MILFKVSLAKAKDLPIFQWNFLFKCGRKSSSKEKSLVAQLESDLQCLENALINEKAA